ncbi:MAG: oligosaccharide flippase family protein [Deltaproteobacteria bacterium]|nr:oligosaccharide flippase family protein [Nannocystaceae bacterium]
MASEQRKSGLGGDGIWLGIAKLWFLVASYAITISLTHLLSADVYGSYYAIARLIAVPNMVIIYTLLFSVSRPLAAQYDSGCPDYAALRARGIKVALGLGGPTAVVLFLAAPLLADWLADPSLTDAIRVVAPISLVYALYAINLGTLNAVRQFRRQASLDIAMATSKSVFIIAAAAAGLGLVATVGGFTLASVFALLLSLAMVRRVAPRPTAPSQPLQSMASFAGLLVVFTAITNLLQSIDMLLLKSFAMAVEQNEAVGFYASAQQIALVPYSLMNAVALLAFPLIASIDVEREQAKVRLYIQQTAKVAIVLLAFMSSVGSACADEIQALLFPKAYGAAADELRLLVWGFSGYSFAVTVAWILNSAKRSRAAVLLVTVPLVVVWIAGRVLIPTMFTGGAAWAVGGAGALAVVTAMIALQRTFSAHIPMLQLLRVGLCVAVVELAARVWPTVRAAGMVGKLAIVAKLGVLAVVFIGAALLTKTVTVAELKGLRRGG